ncbi:MAG: hypothetical protein K8R85_16370 [Bacteroidetes bacterium]|nr:hypothetical protein [Bacteroidota bacterium]
MNIKIIIIAIFLLTKTAFSQTIDKNNSEKTETAQNIAVLTIDQKYEGVNIFVQNPFSTRDGGQLCITDVIINTTSIHIPEESINATAFEIPLNKYNINLGDSVHIKIYHKNGCLPTILNPKIR